LSKLDPVSVVEELKTKSQGQPVVLLCYEKSGSFCHRHLVAEWLNKYLAGDEKVVEFDTGERVKSCDGVKQISLWG